jgi:hypothetical protein
MPRLPDNAVPAYRLHKSSGQAIVTLCGKDICLSSHGTPQSQEKYRRVIAEWLANGRQLPKAPANLTINEIAAAFWTHAERYYHNPHSESTSEASLN